MGAGLYWPVSPMVKNVSKKPAKFQKNRYPIKGFKTNGQTSLLEAIKLLFSFGVEPQKNMTDNKNKINASHNDLKI